MEADEEPRQPTLTISASDDAASLAGRLRRSEGGSLSGTAVDVTFRYRGAPDDADVRGVLAISNRVTGEFLLETNAPGADLVHFVTAARRYAERSGGATRYRVRILVGDESILEFEKRTLLLYSEEGELLRQQSLIPSGVEI